MKSQVVITLSKKIDENQKKELDQVLDSPLLMKTLTDIYKLAAENAFITELDEDFDIDVEIKSVDE